MREAHVALKVQDYHRLGLTHDADDLLDIAGDIRGWF